jgi:glyoxylase-like metal-dependent hydrolase (beta-lactamase superfamily II)
MLEEICEGIYLVHGFNRGRFPFSHSILAAGERNVLFDTGCGPEACREAAERFPLDLVVNSHTHPDHFSGNGNFAGYKLKVPEMFGGMLADLSRMSVRLAGGGEAAGQWLFMVEEILGHRPVEPTSFFKDGDVIDCGGGLRFTAVHTPGHLADHFCFFEEQRGILLSFDIDLTPFGPWYGHVESDISTFRASLEKIAALQPRLVVSSHRPPVTSGIEGELSAFAAVFDRRARVVLELLERRPATPEMLADLSPFYGLQGRTFALYHYFESRMLEKHLDLLVDAGQASRDEKGIYSLKK